MYPAAATTATAVATTTPMPDEALDMFPNFVYCPNEPALDAVIGLTATASAAAATSVAAAAAE